MDTFRNFYLLKDKSKREEIKKCLLAYCRLDTLATIRILEILMKIAKIQFRTYNCPLMIVTFYKMVGRDGY